MLMNPRAFRAPCGVPVCLELFVRCLAWFCSLGEVLLPASGKACELSYTLCLRKNSVTIREAHGYSMVPSL